MDINSKDLGKIVELPVRPGWGPGIVGRMDDRFVYIFFTNEKDLLPKKFFLTENKLKLAKNQNEPGLVKRARRKNKKIAPVLVEVLAGPVPKTDTAKPSTVGAPKGNKSKLRPSA